MLSFQLKENINIILNAFGEAEYFFELLEKLNFTFEKIEKHIDNISKGGNESAHVHNQLRNDLAQVKNSLEGFSSRKVYKTLEKLQSDINPLIHNELYNSSLLEEIYHALEHFSNLYETFMDNGYSPEYAGAMVLEANSLSALFDGVKKGLHFYLDNIEVQIIKYDDDEKSLISIFLPSTMNLTEFNKKLQAFEKIYYELCMIFNISPEDYPIEIIKIESGSWYSKLLGEKRVIDFIVNSLGSIARFFHRNYTKEGQIGEIPKQAEALEKIIGLRKNIIESGIDVDEEMTEYIKKSSNALAKNFTLLVSSESEITVNDTTLLITKAEQQKSLPNNEPLKLEKDD